MAASPTRLSNTEIDSLLHELTQWSYCDGELVRESSFADFAQAMIFVDRVAELAEEANHHPDIHIRYNRVRIALVTHDARAITARDSALARRIDALSL